MFEVTIKRVCKKCVGNGRVPLLKKKTWALCAICDGRGYKEVKMVVSGSSMSESEELVRTDGYRQGLFDPYAGDKIVLVDPIDSNLYVV